MAISDQGIEVVVSFGDHLSERYVKEYTWAKLGVGRPGLLGLIGFGSQKSNPLEFGFDCNDGVIGGPIVKFQSTLLTEEGGIVMNWNSSIERSSFPAEVVELLPQLKYRVLSNLTPGGMKLENSESSKFYCVLPGRK